MSSEVDPRLDPSTVNDEASFLAFVKALEVDRRLAAELEKETPVPYGSHRGWQNATIEQFLEAAASWAEDTRFGRTQGLEGASPWRQFAVFLYCGKIYE